MIFSENFLSVEIFLEWNAPLENEKEILNRFKILNFTCGNINVDPANRLLTNCIKKTIQYFFKYTDDTVMKHTQSTHMR